jgi:hypothetical protein
MKISGELLNNHDGTFSFRVYSREGNFTDYDIVASDISIIIDDDFVTLTKTIDGKDILDYTDEVLGRT